MTYAEAFDPARTPWDFLASPLGVVLAIVAVGWICAGLAAILRRL